MLFVCVFYFSLLFLPDNYDFGLPIITIEIYCSMLPEKTELPALRPSRSQSSAFALNYHQLQAGINRLRYIKKKQQKHNHLMAEHLNSLLHKLQQQQNQSASTSATSCATPTHFSQQTFLGKYNIQEHSPYHSKQHKISPHKPINTQSGFLLPPKTEQGRIPFRELRDVKIADRSQTRQGREKEALSSKEKQYMKKQENCHEMKELRLQRQQKKRQLFQQKIDQARQRKVKLLLSQQEGRKKVSEEYFRHIERIREQKKAERERKARLNELKCQQLMEIQRQEEEELAVFEKSLVMEESLRQCLGRVGTQEACREVLSTDASLLK